MPVYGGFPYDAGVTVPEDAEATTDARPDHIFIAPPYGLPPGG
jgi:hypothetical protein